MLQKILKDIISLLQTIYILINSEFFSFAWSS